MEKTVAVVRARLTARWAIPLILMLGYLGFSGAARAATVTWDGPDSGKWTTAANWDTNMLPTAADDVVINATGTVTLPASSGTQAIKNLTTTRIQVLAESTLSVSGTVSLNGDLTLAGGTLKGGTVNGPGQVRWDVATQGGTLDGVTLNVNLSPTNGGGSSLIIVNGLTLNGTATLPRTTGLQPGLSFKGSQTLDGTGTVLLNYSYLTNDPVGAPDTLTIGPGITVTAIGQSFIFNFASIINNGLLQANGAGVFLTLGQSLTNTGMVQAINGGTVNLASELRDTWSNTGTIKAESGGTLNLRGTFTPATYSTVTNNGGTVRIGSRGLLDNTNNTLALTNGDLGLFGGTLRGGTINGPGQVRWHGEALGSTLDGVTLNANLSPIGDFGNTLIIVNSLTFNGTATLTRTTYGQQPGLSFKDSQTLSGTGSIVLSYGYLTGYSGNETLTISPNITVTATGQGSFNNFSSIINNGLIKADVGTLTINADTGTWRNNGIIEAKNGGTFTADKGPANLVNNALTGGTYRVYDNSTLSWVASGFATNAATIYLNGANANFYRDADNNTSALSGLTTNGAAGNFTITNGYAFTRSADFTNAGSLTVGNNSTFSLTGANSDYIQSGGTTTLQNGTLDPTGAGGIINIQGGVVKGTGALVANTTNASTLSPGASPGVLNVTGNYTQTAAGTLLMELNGTTPGTQYDQLNVTGTVLLDGTLTLVPNFDIADNDSFTLVTNDLSDAITGTFSGLPEGAYFAMGSQLFRISYIGGSGNDIALTSKGPALTLSINDVTLSEGNGGTVNAQFTVTLSSPSSQTVTVNYSTADDTAVAPGDYTAVPSTLLTFAPGQTSQFVTVVVKGEALAESDETFTVNLSNAVNAALLDGTGLGTIKDDDILPLLSINDITVTESNGGSTQAAFTLALSAPSTRTVSVVAQSSAGGSPAATPGADYSTLAPTTITFTPGQVTRTVNVTISGDIIDENNEKFAVSLSIALYATISDNIGVGTILDNDNPPLISVSAPNVTEGNSGDTTSMTLTIKLSAASARNISVQYQTTNATTFPATAGADYTAVPLTTVIFNAGQTTKTVNVTVNGDVLDEDSERIKLNLTNPVNATLGTVSEGIIVDDDATPSLSINDVSVSEGNAGTSQMTFTVTLSAASGRTITVNVATGNGGSPAATAGSDYVALASTLLTFAPGQTSKQVSVTINGDTSVEGNEKFGVILSGAVNATIADNSGIGTILNDDAAGTLAPQIPSGDEDSK